VEEGDVPCQSYRMCREFELLLSRLSERKVQLQGEGTRLHEQRELLLRQVLLVYSKMPVIGDCFPR
jgi:hypothetical protein